LAEDLKAATGRWRAVPRDTIAAYLAVIDTASAIQDLLAEALLDPKSRIGFLWTLFRKLPAAMGTPGQTGVFRVPLTPAQRLGYLRLQEAIRLGNAPLWPDPESAIAKLKEVNTFVPEGMVLFFLGRFQLDLGRRAEAADTFEK